MLFLFSKKRYNRYMNTEELLKLEMKKCWLYFYENTNLDKNSKFFGLTRDKYPLFPEVASISSTGYSLASLIIGVENSWLDYEEGYDIALNTIKTFLYKIKSKNGFFHRYINIETGKKEWNSEISIIDTALLLCGVLAVGEYFEDEVKDLGLILFENVEWNWFIDKEKKQYRLGYKRGFYGYWDNYAEQLIIYILGAGSLTNQIDKDIYYSFERRKKDYEEQKGIIYSWFGSLFTYQYSHAWIDFKKLYDEKKVNWFDNSKKAILANKMYCYTNREKIKTFKEGYWGISATITKKRYSQRHGAEPCVDKIKLDGTISISALISSIVFYSEEVIEKVNRLYKDYPSSFGKYGFMTSMNLNYRDNWFSSEYLSIDKGNSMIMIANYLDDKIWKLMMSSEIIQRGLDHLNIKDI
jgi:Uncharacterized protein conserved in bacteria